MSRAYYNEIDPYAAEWLKNLIAAGHIAPGDVDTRSITDVAADDLRSYAQCHFFAGIGVWSHALRLSGWSDDRPVWTGSCPCQPFSVAGKGAGQTDDRHLWPVWFNLIEQCRPPVVFGEQVEAAIRHGWLDLVQGGLESIGYASGAVCIPASSVGAPHIRQRLWFVAHASSAASQWDTRSVSQAQAGERGAYRDQHGYLSVGHSYGGSNGVMAYADRENQSGRGIQRLGQGYGAGNGATCERSETTSPTDHFWQDADWLFCRDGKWRRVEPGTFPLAYGAPARVGRLRAYGNAIVPQVAQEVIQTFMEYAP